MTLFAMQDSKRTLLRINMKRTGKEHQTSNQTKIKDIQQKRLGFHPRLFCW